jgi:hypothetical protein
MADLGELKVKISADAGQLERDLNSASGSVGKFGDETQSANKKVQDSTKKSEAAIKAMAAASAAAAVGAAAALVKLVSSTLNAADEQIKLARQLDMTSEQLAVLSRVGELTGVALSEITTASRMLDTELGKAASGVDGAAQKFAALGLSVEELNAMSTDERMRAIGQAIGDMGTHAEKTAAATELFGRNGQKMLLMLDGADAAFSRAESEVTKFGLAVSKVDAQRIEAINDNLSAMQASGRGAALSLVTSLAPALETVTAMVTGQTTLATATEMLTEASREYNQIVNTLATSGDTLNATERQTLENRRELLGMEINAAMRALALEFNRSNKEIEKQQENIKRLDGTLQSMYDAVRVGQIDQSQLAERIKIAEQDKIRALEVVNTLTEQQTTSMQSVANAVYDGVINIEAYRQGNRALYDQIMQIVAGIGQQRAEQTALDEQRAKAAAEEQSAAQARARTQAEQAERDRQGAELIAGRIAALKEYDTAVALSNQQLQDGFITEEEQRVSLINATRKHAEALYALGYTAQDTGSIGGLALQNMIDKLREFGEEVESGGNIDAALEALRQRFVSEEEVLRAGYEQRRALIEELNQQGLIDADEFHELSIQNEQEYQDRVTEIQQQAQEQRNALMNSGFNNLSRNLVSLYSNLGSVMEKDEKKLFEIRKNAATAMAIIDGLSAVQSAYKAGAAIPGGGPVTGAIFAGIAAAATAANVMAIRSQTYGGGGSITAPAATAPSAPAESRPTSTMMVNLQGDFFSGASVRGLMDKIAEAQADGYKVVMA